MTHALREQLVAAATREELVEGIVAVLERTYRQVGPTAGLLEFFRALDELTLRAIAYQHGVFEGAAEAEPEREDRE